MCEIDVFLIAHVYIANTLRERACFNVMRYEMESKGTENISGVARTISRTFKDFLSAKEAEIATGKRPDTLALLERQCDDILEWLINLDPETVLWINDKGKFVTALDYQKEITKFRMARLMPARVEVAPVGENPVVTRDELTKQAIIGLPGAERNAPDDSDLEDES